MRDHYFNVRKLKVIFTSQQQYRLILVQVGKAQEAIFII